MDEIQKILERIPGLPRIDRADLLSDGVVNQVWRLECASGPLVLRRDKPLAGKLGLDRFAEVEIHQSAASVGIAPALIWSDPQAGLLLTEYVQGNVLVEEDMRDPETFARVVALIQQVWCIPERLPPVSLAACARRYANVVATDEADKLAAAVAQLDAKWCADASRFVLCHNDLVNGNIIRTVKDDFMLIDWEYAGLGEPAFDMAVLLRHQRQGGEQRQTLLNSRVGKVDEARLAGCAGLYDRLLALWLMLVSADEPEGPGCLTEALQEARSRLSH
jgi:aminoglycoside phosphotransferase (APT) family kinase protein